MNNLKSTTYLQTTLSFENNLPKHNGLDITFKQVMSLETFRAFGRDLTNISILTEKTHFNNKRGLIQAIDLINNNQATKNKRNKNIIKRHRELKSKKRTKDKQKIIQSQIFNFILPIDKETSNPSKAKPKQVKIDNDAKLKEDNPNPQLVSEYQYEILNYYQIIDSKYDIDKDYMTNQYDINENMRSILIDWLIEVNQKYKMRLETLYLTVHIIDQYLSKRIIDRKKLQLVGITALFIAGKYEEIYPPNLKHYVIITDNAYQKDDVINMEKSILKTLQYDFAIPSSLRYFELIQHFIPFNNNEIMLSQFILELSLLDYNMIQYSHGLVAVSVLCLVRKLISIQSMTYDDIIQMFNFERKTINKCMQQLYTLYTIETQKDCYRNANNKNSQSHSNNNKIELKAIKEKYCNKLFFEPIKVGLSISHIYI